MTAVRREPQGSRVRLVPDCLDPMEQFSAARIPQQQRSGSVKNRQRLAVRRQGQGIGMAFERWLIGADDLARVRATLDHLLLEGVFGHRRDNTVALVAEELAAQVNRAALAAFQLHDFTLRAYERLSVRRNN